MPLQKPRHLPIAKANFERYICNLLMSHFDFLHANPRKEESKAFFVGRVRAAPDMSKFVESLLWNL